MADALAILKPRFFPRESHSSKRSEMENFLLSNWRSCNWITRTPRSTVLRAKNVVVGNKRGTQVFHLLREPVLVEVLDILRRYFYAPLTGLVIMIEELAGRGG